MSTDEQPEMDPTRRSIFLATEYGPVSIASIKKEFTTVPLGLEDTLASMVEEGVIEVSRFSNNKRAFIITEAGDKELRNYMAAAMRYATGMDEHPVKGPWEDL